MQNVSHMCGENSCRFLYKSNTNKSSDHRAATKSEHEVADAALLFKMR